MMELYEAIKSDISWLIFIYLIVYFALDYLYNKMNLGLDDSDKDGQNRSHMKVHTDYKTGLQYLRVGNTLTPRLNVDGAHMQKDTK